MSKKITTWTRPAGEYSTLAARILDQTHTLIAGTTGSGKSVLVRSILQAIMLDFPTNKQVILLDPKRTELWQYRNIPHCIGYASEPEAMAKLLSDTMRIIDDRTRRTRAREACQSTEPHIYVIIDEYADLMTTCKKLGAVTTIQRIAQLGRSSNVHLIIATQRPTRDVITGAIKVNLDCRIALRVPTAQDSRNIVNVSGAELLPRYGQGLMLTPESNTPELIEPYYHTPEETQKLVDCWTEQTNDIRKRIRCKNNAQIAALIAAALLTVLIIIL